MSTTKVETAAGTLSLEVECGMDERNISDDNMPLGYWEEHITNVLTAVLTELVEAVIEAAPSHAWDGESTHIEQSKRVAGNGGAFASYSLSGDLGLKVPYLILVELLSSMDGSLAHEFNEHLVFSESIDLAELMASDPERAMALIGQMLGQSSGMGFEEPRPARRGGLLQGLRDRLGGGRRVDTVSMRASEPDDDDLPRGMYL